MKFTVKKIRVFLVLSFAISLLLSPWGPEEKNLKAQAPAGGGGTPPAARGGGGGGTDPKNPANPTPFGLGEGGCIFPMAVGNEWTYTILQKKKKLGELFVKVESRRKVTWNVEKEVGMDVKTVDLNVFLFSFRDSSTGKTHKREFFRYRYYEILQIRNNRIYPIIKTYMHLGQQVGQMLVVNVKREEFQGQKMISLKMRHLKKKRSQKFLDWFGLYEYEKDSLLYRLTKAKIKPDVCVEGER